MYRPWCRAEEYGAIWRTTNSCINTTFIGKCQISVQARTLSFYRLYITALIVLEKCVGKTYQKPEQWLHTLQLPMRPLAPRIQSFRSHPEQTDKQIYFSRIEIIQALHKRVECALQGLAQSSLSGLSSLFSDRYIYSFHRLFVTYIAEITEA